MLEWVYRSCVVKGVYVSIVCVNAVPGMSAEGLFKVRWAAWVFDPAGVFSPLLNVIF